MDNLPLEIVRLIAGESRLVYHPLILAYPRFARSLTLGDRLDYAEAFGYDCRVVKHRWGVGLTWLLDGKLHRIDRPAIELEDGTIEYYEHGKLHRVDGPAAIHTSGYRAWAICGVRHRSGAPARIYPCGATEWYCNGLLHREDGPAKDIPECKSWYVNGSLHREDGPAIIMANGDKAWYINGLLHRTTGPAVEIENGAVEWWICGKRLTEKQFRKMAQN